MIWNIVNTAASIVTCISFAIAAYTWSRERNRVMDGLLSVGGIGQENQKKTAIRLQNVGGCGLVIQMIWLTCESYSAEIDGQHQTPSNVLMPGESFYLYSDEAKADMVVSYVTHNDVNTRHLDSFAVESTGIVPNRLYDYVKPSWKKRRLMKYGKGNLFTEQGMVPQRRTVPMKNQAKQRGTALDNAITWLDKNGYHAIHGGVA